MKLLTKLLTRIGLLPQPILSKREREILYLMRYGHRNKEIATFLGISEQTVKNHISHIYSKLRVGKGNKRIEAIGREYGS